MSFFSKIYRILTFCVWFPIGDKEKDAAIEICFAFLSQFDINIYPKKQESKNSKKWCQASREKADSGKILKKSKKVTCPIFINTIFLNLDPLIFLSIHFNSKIFRIDFKSRNSLTRIKVKFFEIVFLNFRTDFWIRSRFYFLIF